MSVMHVWCSWIFNLILTFGVVAVSSCPNNAMWCDEFDVDGPPDRYHWIYDLGDGGWGNSETQRYTKDNAYVRNGLLHIDVKQNSHDGSYTSARIKSQDRILFQYVTLEASIQIPDLTGGLWPAFWTLGANIDQVGWPFCGELDIAEWGSMEAQQGDQLNSHVTAGAHWADNESGEHVYQYASFVSESKLSEGFHLYKLIWTPTTIEQYIDNQLYFQLDITSQDELGQPQFILLNVAVGGLFTGISNPTSQGGKMLVDWVRAYDNGSGSQVLVIPCEDPCLFLSSSSPTISIGLVSCLWMSLSVLLVFSSLLSC